MTERNKDVSNIWAKMAANRNKETFLKNVFGFQASSPARELFKAIDEAISQNIQDQSLPEGLRQQLAELLLKVPPNEETKEQVYRQVKGLPIPSVARSESIITKDEVREMTGKIQTARQIMMSKGEPVEDSEGTDLCVDIPKEIKDETGISFSFIASLDETDLFLGVTTDNPIPEIREINCNFWGEGEEVLYFDLDILGKGSRYMTSRTSFKEMASNEHAIIEFCLNRSLEKMGKI